MNKKKYHSINVKRLLKQKKIATLDELKQELETDTTMTIYRKLCELSYHTSYSHGSRYYTLNEIAKFDEKGLWSYQGVYFSKYGTLKETVKVFVKKSVAGYSCRELKRILNTEAKEQLLDLVRRGEIVREKWLAVYIYFSSSATKRRIQKAFRREQSANAIMQFDDSNLRTASIRFFSLLDERLRRLYAGLLSLQYEHGGDVYIAERFGLDVHTVAKGRKEITSELNELEQTRETGGGRKSIKKNAPNRNNP